jgi:peroxiredoxin
MDTSVRPGDEFPIKSFQMLEGGARDLASLLDGSAGLLLIVYRGKQCSYCKAQLREIEERYDEICQREFSVLAVSADTAERARQTQQDLALRKLQLAYGLDLEKARGCGLYISNARKDSEMPQFSEPGIFLIRPNETLETAWLSSFAFPRPPLEGIIQAIDFVKKVDPSLPPRGSA